MRNEFSASYHVTTNATNTPIANDCLVFSMNLCVTNAGTTWAIAIKDKEATPKTLFSLSPVTVGNFIIPLSELGGCYMAGGIDIVTSGTTPGVLDVWVAGSRLT